jgi:hypothetical protein
MTRTLLCMDWGCVHGLFRIDYTSFRVAPSKWVMYRLGMDVVDDEVLVVPGACIWSAKSRYVYLTRLTAAATSW